MITQTKKKKPPPNWDLLFHRLSEVYIAAGQKRKKSVLDNHTDKKERICRRLGVISEADIVRISNQLGVGPKSLSK
jgi:hypothetical protein